jgi:hypothetical protein
MKRIALTLCLVATPALAQMQPKMPSQEAISAATSSMLMECIGKRQLAESYAVDNEHEIARLRQQLAEARKQSDDAKADLAKMKPASAKKP